MAHLHLLELEGFRNALYDIVVVTFVAIDQMAGWTLRTLVTRVLTGSSTFGKFSGAISFGLEDSIDDKHDKYEESIKSD